MTQPLRVIGRYEIKSMIARGGMATVYHAYDPRFERDVAIKVLPQAFLHDPQFRVRFEREAKMIALLEHPAIVPVYDFGEQDGQPYIVMRFMSGGALTDRLKNEAISLGETAQIITRLAPALDAAHARGIIHRDLKPGNVLFDQYGNAYLSDFGIARLAAGSGATLTGESILGTPAYMSPEQVQGDKAIDGRSDLYALGVLIFQMMAGQVPYQSDTPAKVMMMHVLQPVPDLHSVRPELPEASSALIRKAMAKDPDERFSNAGDLAAALEQAVRGAAGLSAQPRPGLEQQSLSQRPDFRMPTAASPGETILAPAGGAPPVRTHPRQPPPGGRAAPGQPAASAKAGARPTAAPWLPIVIALCLLLSLAAGGLALAGRRGVGPLALLAASSATPPPATPSAAVLPGSSGGGAALSAPETLTPSPPTDAPPTDAPPPATDTAPPPTAALSPTAPAPAGGPVVGGADKLAYIDKNDIWIANLDGSDHMALTDDGAVKSNLQWTPDGQGVNYISGKCAYSVRIADKQKEIITCFNFVQYFKAFEISPDGSQVAVSLDNQLYILPYDLNTLRSISVRGDLSKVAPCQDFAPWLKLFVKYPRWGKDGKTLAMVIMGAARGIGSADTVQLIDYAQCSANPKVLDNFPPPRFTPEEYKAAPSILQFGWDGYSLFTFSTFIRNGGFGKLYVYNSDLKKPQGPLNVAGECCYRDPIFSPDGSHLLFAFQKYPGGDGTTQLFMVPYGALGTGQSFSPLPLPAIDPKTQPIPALRPAK